MKLCASFAFLVAAACAAAQSQLAGRGQFPQFRSLSGLPGGGFGVDASGTPTFKGAMSLSTPIAYSLARRHMAFAVAFTSQDRQFRLFDSDSGENSSNGTGAGMMGFSGRLGDLTVGGMLLSSAGDTVLNLQWTPAGQQGRLRYAVGVQDVFSTGGTAGEAIDLAEGGGNSRSLFAVATAELAPSVYASAGVGSGRFRTPFFNLSGSFHERIKALAEYDGFNWNYGLAADLGSFSLGAKDAEITLFGGYVRGRYATVSVAISF